MIYVSLTIYRFLVGQVPPRSSTTYVVADAVADSDPESRGAVRAGVRVPSLVAPIAAAEAGEAWQAARRRGGAAAAADGKAKGRLQNNMIRSVRFPIHKGKYPLKRRAERSGGGAGAMVSAQFSSNT